MKTRWILSGAVAACGLFSGSLHAQTTHAKDTTMNRTVVVEQEYNPDIMDAAKVNVLPKVEEPTVGKKEAEYATNLFPATVIPGSVMFPYAGKEVQPGSTPGYARLGYGNYGNLDVWANYLFRLSDSDRLNLHFQMDGRNGKLKLPYSTDEKWDSHYYRTRAALDYAHDFGKVNLDVAGRFGLSNFNFLPGSLAAKQKFTSGDLHLGVQSTDETAPVRFHAETNLLMYERQHNPMGEDFSTAAVGETLVRTQGHVSGAISDQQSITIGVEMNNLIYNKEAYDNYTTLLLRPYYELDNEAWKLHVGANVDFSFGFDKSFRVSPDVTAQYTFADSYVLYIRATGGKLHNDFRRLETVCPYGDLNAKRTYDTYELVNGALGFKASPYPGVWFHLYGGYQDLRNDLLYTYASATTSSAGPVGTLLEFTLQNTRNTYAGAEVTYDYKDLFSLSARYTYRNWSSSENEYLLVVKPESEASLSLQVRPVSAFCLNLGYDYLRRKQEVSALRPDDVNDLHAGITYNVFKGVSIYAKAHNLLNQKYQYYPAYPSEGFNFVGGLSFRF